jgi:hypothetical protein
MDVRSAAPENVGDKVGARVGAKVVGACVGGLVSPRLVGTGVGAAHTHNRAAPVR